MKGPQPVQPARLFEFVRDSKLAVLFVSAHPLHKLNRPLVRQLASEHQDIGVGVMKLAALLRAGPSVLRFLHQGLRDCEAPAAFGVLPGYYLFHSGTMLTWDPGLPGLADVTALARGALLGALWSSVSSDATFIRQALLLAADQSAADRVTVVFRQAIAEAGARAQRRAARRTDAPPDDELYWAYQVLGVLPTATDREVHEAWRRRRTENHPDHASGDPVEYERRTRVSRDINLARDIIVKHRHPGTRGATHAWAS